MLLTNGLLLGGTFYHSRNGLFELQKAGRRCPSAAHVGPADVAVLSCAKIVALIHWRKTSNENSQRTFEDRLHGEPVEKYSVDRCHGSNNADWSQATTKFGSDATKFWDVH